MQRILLAALWLTVSTIAWAQGPPEALEVLFEVATVDEARIQITPDQYLDLKRIVRLAKMEREGEALELWKVYVEREVINGSSEDFHALGRWMVREAYLNFGGIPQAARCVSVGPQSWEL